MPILSCPITNLSVGVMDVVRIIVLANTIGVYAENVSDVQKLEELLQQHGYEPDREKLWRQILPTPARAIAAADNFAHELRQRGYRVAVQLL
jgi:hypothetical protein